jgi:ferrous iron transport protein B
MLGKEPASSTPPLLRTVALIGNPNTGKSSLFNALCGMNARVGNYPGVTVEQKVGRLTGSRLTVDVIDLPGTYSLAARSADEAVAVNVLTGTFPNQAKPELAVVILDAANIERNLYLFSQVYELGLPVLVVLNMWDRVESEGIKVDADLLSKRLGVPVVCTSANKRKGIELVREAIERLLLSPPDQIQPSQFARAQFPAVFHAEVEELAAWLASQGKSSFRFQVDRLLIDTDGEYQRSLCQSGLHEINDRIAASRNRLAEAGCKVPMFETKIRYAWIRRTIEGAVTRRESKSVSWSDKVDKWLTHRWVGMFAFVLIMFLVFQSITFFAALPMQGIETLQGWIGAQVEGVLPPGALRSLFVDGVVAGVGGVLMFLPQIAILFFFIAVLEDCGYIARAAFVMDKLMSSVGLSGKSFLPLMSSFACAVPGIMATRTIENRKDRMVTLLIAPLMSCSARMPVYILMVSAFVPATTYAAGWVSLQGLVLLGMQSIGAIVAIPVAWFLKKFFFPGETATFLMELHSYKWPSPFVIYQRVWERVLAFVTRAGTLIFCTTVLVWAAGYFPGDHDQVDAATSSLEKQQAELASLESQKAKATESQEASKLEQLDGELEKTRLAIAEETDRVNALRSSLIENSFLGLTGRFIEPAVKPLGWDWKIGVAVIASFPAREVIISTLGTIYSLGSAEDHESEGLQAQMKDAQWPDGRPVFSLATAMSIMIFFALCAQCSATLMTIRRETNSWRWPIFSFVYMTTLAYIGAWIAFKVFS